MPLFIGRDLRTEKGENIVNVTDLDVYLLKTRGLVSMVQLANTLFVIKIPYAQTHI